MFLRIFTTTLLLRWCWTRRWFTVLTAMMLVMSVTMTFFVFWMLLLFLGTWRRAWWTWTRASSSFLFFAFHFIFSTVFSDDFPECFFWSFCNKLFVLFRGSSEFHRHFFGNELKSLFFVLEFEFFVLFSVFVPSFSFTLLFFWTWRRWAWTRTRARAWASFMTSFFTASFFCCFHFEKVMLMSNNFLTLLTQVKFKTF